MKILRVIEIPVIIRLIGDPVLLAERILGVKNEPDKKEASVNKSILVGKNAECRLRGYNIREEPRAPQDLLLSFGILEQSAKQDVSEFLFRNLTDKKGIVLIIGENETPLEETAIRRKVEEYV